MVVVVSLKESGAGNDNGGGDGRFLAFFEEFVWIKREFLDSGLKLFFVTLVGDCGSIFDSEFIIQTAGGGGEIARSFVIAKTSFKRTEEFFNVVTCCCEVVEFVEFEEFVGVKEGIEEDDDEIVVEVVLR